MGDSLIQITGEKKILEYKLDKIRNFIESRINIVDSVTKNELNVILNMIKQYEHVDSTFELSKPLIENIPEEEFDNVQ